MDAIFWNYVSKIMDFMPKWNIITFYYFKMNGSVVWISIHKPLKILIELLSSEASKCLSYLTRFLPFLFTRLEQGYCIL